MTLILWVRLMADLSFYYAYAGFFVSLTGSAFCLPGIVLPSLFCALSRSAELRLRTRGSGGLRKAAPAEDTPDLSKGSSDGSFEGKIASGDSPARNAPHGTSACADVSEGKDGRLLRMTLLLPSLICFLLPGITAGDRIALLPALLYMAALAWTDRFSLSCDRQKDVFLLFLKTYPIFCLLVTAMGGYRGLISSSLSPALLTVVLCVFLLRTLRHDPKVYRDPRFLMGSSVSLAAILVGTFLLQLRSVTDAAAAAFLALYNSILVPLLSAVLYAVAFLLTLIVTPLLSLAQGGETTSSTLDLSTGEIMNQAGENADGSPVAAMVLNVLAAVIVCVFFAVLLLILFRRLAGTRDIRKTSLLSTQERRSDTPYSPAETADHLPASPLHPVNRIRRQYRRYLQICRKKGFHPYPFHTSQDICSGTSGFFPDPSCAERLRELYIQARYHGTATPEEAAEARDLMHRLTE